MLAARARTRRQPRQIDRYSIVWWMTGIASSRKRSVRDEQQTLRRLDPGTSDLKLRTQNPGQGRKIGGAPPLCRQTANATRDRKARSRE